MSENKYNLSHVVLYAKGWYKTTDDVWADLIEILKLDNYTPFTKGDVYSILLSSIEKKEFEYRFTDVKSILTGIHPTECWKTGYYTKDATWLKDHKTLPDYDMPTAFVYYLLSNFRFMDTKYWNIVVPKYKKYPKSENITIRKIYDLIKKR